jgi:hypothetical protein
VSLPLIIVHEGSHVDTSRREFHEQHGTSESALNAVPFERLCPGADKLGTILQAFR